MKILISGGGTGGHIYPAIAIANELRERHPDWIIEFAGRHNSIEGRVVPPAGYVIHNLHVAGYERYYSFFEKLSVIGRLAVSLKDSLVLLRKIKPDIVIGTGGFICGPILYVAGLKKIPTLICEQNVIPGFTIKTLSKRADVVCTAYEETSKYMVHPERCVVTGNPVRKDFATIGRNEARTSLSLADGCRMILSFGGSLGAKTINDSVADMIAALKDRSDFYFYHITGRSSYEEFMDRMHEAGVDSDQMKNVTIAEYSNEMPTLLHAADLVIARSGAMTISEINYVGVPAIYSPYPFAANDHQMKNARASERAGGSITIADEDLTGEKLIETIRELYADPDRLAGMAKCSAQLGIRNSAERICEQAEHLLVQRMNAK